MQDQSKNKNSAQPSVESHPSLRLCVIGITGTNGKTTVSHLIGDALKAGGYHPFVLGTLNSNNRDLSTPEADDIARLMQEHIDQKGTHFILEVTSEGIDQGRVADVDFNVKLLTNVTTDHLDYHKTFNAYQNIKLDFMRMGDSYKIYPENFSEVTTPIPTILYGKFNQLNVQAAALVLRHIGMEELTIQRALSICPAPRGRMEPIDRGQDYQVFVDYAHTPAALESVLRAGRAMVETNEGRLLLLFGCGGNRDSQKRPLMGETASQYADLVIVTEDNPRFEDSQSIINDIIKGFPAEFKNYRVIQDRRAAIAHIINHARHQDVVILAGKGHETYQIHGSETLHLDDREEALKVLSQQSQLTTCTSEN
ncbi:MAG: UDP-N-acetylmuramoyl-L-alanyl-D-glutamate--2,6-diaminopimelate ligase [Bermanella sp.]